MDVVGGIWKFKSIFEKNTLEGSEQELDRPFRTLDDSRGFQLRHRGGRGFSWGKVQQKEMHGFSELDLRTGVNRPGVHRSLLHMDKRYLHLFLQRIQTGQGLMQPGVEIHF